MHVSIRVLVRLVLQHEEGQQAHPRAHAQQRDLRRADVARTRLKRKVLLQHNTVQYSTGQYSELPDSRRAHTHMPG